MGHRRSALIAMKKVSSTQTDGTRLSQVVGTRRTSVLTVVRGLIRKNIGTIENDTSLSTFCRRKRTCQAPQKREAGEVDAKKSGGHQREKAASEKASEALKRSPLRVLPPPAFVDDRLFAIMIPLCLFQALPVVPRDLQKTVHTD